MWQYKDIETHEWVELPGVELELTSVGGINVATLDATEVTVDENSDWDSNAHFTYAGVVQFPRGRCVAYLAGSEGYDHEVDVNTLRVATLEDLLLQAYPDILKKEGV